MATSSPLTTSCDSDSASASNNPMMFAFTYISSKLAHRNVHLDFILDDSHSNINNNQGCILIPLRPLSLSEQTLITKIAISARAKFPNFQVQSRSLDRGALTSSSPSSPGSAVALSVDDNLHAAAATDSNNKQSSPDSSSSSTTRTRTRTKREYIFEVVDPIHLLHQSNIPHHVVFNADGLLVLSIDPSPSSNDDDGVEGEEFILHSASYLSSSLNARVGIEGGGADIYESPIYGFGLKDYFRNNPRLGRADGDVSTRNDNNNPSHESEDDVVSMRRRRRKRRDDDENNNNTAVKGQIANRKEAARRPIPSFKGKKPSSAAFNINNNNGAYPSSSSSLIQTPPVAAPHCHYPHRSHHQQQQQHHHHHHHRRRRHRDTGSSSSCSNNKMPSFEFAALSEYPLYRRESGLGIYNTTAAASSFCSTTVVAATTGRGYDHDSLPPPSSHLMDEEEKEAESGWWKGMVGEEDDRSTTTTMILGSEWEAFRRIGLGVGG